MFEKVNPGHPDKMADRLAGAVVDLVYERAGGLTKANPRVACEVMAGHGRVDVQIETSLGRMDLRAEDIDALIHRLFGERVVGNVLIAPQDAHLSDNQTRGLRCGDNGIFRGCPPTHEQRVLTAIAATIYGRWPYDGKYIINADVPYNPEILDFICEEIKEPITDPYSPKARKMYEEYEKEAWKLALCDLTICQSHTHGQRDEMVISDITAKYIPLGQLKTFFINPLGPWTGGIDVDCGATNRKLGSDMGDGVTGGGLHGKDLSKGDVSINIVCFLKAVQSGQTVTACCSIGDEHVTFTYASGKTETETFADVVKMARLYIMTDCGGSFERFSEWGLIRPKAE